MRIICILFFFLLFHIIFSQDLEYEIYTFDEMINNINDVSYNQTDYDKIIKYLKQVFIDYYVYLDIAKNPPSPFKPVDLIKELDSINTTNINYYDFFKKVYSSILLLQDGHVQIFFEKYIDFYYICPVGYNVITFNENNYLIINYSENILNTFFKGQTSLIEGIKKNYGYAIIDINGEEPFDYIQKFGRYQRYKSEHANFIVNLKRYTFHYALFIYPFEKEDLTNITITFSNNEKITFDYTFFKVKILSNELSKFYEKEMKKNKNNDIKPTIIDIEKKFSEKKKTKRNLQNTIWDLNYQDNIKLKIDNVNRVNVIYQNSFVFEEEINGKKQYDYNSYDIFTLITKKLNMNNYPIIVIEDFNSGGYLGYSLLMQNILNYNLTLNKYNMAEKFKKGINYIDTEIDDYGNNTKHNRTTIKEEDFSFYIYEYFKNVKGKIRKPNEIIVFTDGYSFSATSLFIKNLQETGNAIIVGYNGIPSKEKKNEKFDASQSPSSVKTFNNDLNIINLILYGIYVYGITIDEIYNDSYINKNITPIPKEYLINPIDERSNIYGFYNDNRYLEFINEAKRIFRKYEYECNPDNKNLVLLDDHCKFDDKYLIGGYSCVNCKWSNKCEISNCLKPYTFNTYTRECVENDLTYYLKIRDDENKKENEEKEKLKKDLEDKNQKISTLKYIIYLILSIFVISLITVLILFCKKRKKSKFSTLKDEINIESSINPQN